MGQRVGHAFDRGGDGTALGHLRPAADRRSGRAGLAARSDVGEAFAKGVQPPDAPAQCGRFEEGVCIGGKRNAQARRGQVAAEAFDAGGVGRHGGDVRKQVFGGDGPFKRFGRMRQQWTAQVGFSCFGVVP